MAYETSDEAIRHQIPGAKIERFQVPDVPGAHGWTGPDLARQRDRPGLLDPGPLHDDHRPRGRGAACRATVGRRQVNLRAHGWHLPGLILLRAAVQPIKRPSQPGQLRAYLGGEVAHVLIAADGLDPDDKTTWQQERLDNAGEHAGEELSSLLAGARDVRHLVWLRNRMGDEVADLAIINTGTHAYRRPDGIAVIPAALLTV